ncbi:MAG: family glycosyltransferase [Planctomycetota bacterium]|nr:family glycosyltransferase [Planctomycetota bacterium]
MPDLRALIIDDASPDETSEVAESLVAEDARVHLIRHPANLGHIATYNEGLAWSKADYTVLLSADDLLAPGALARAVDFMDDEAGVGMVHGVGIPFRDGEPPAPSAITSGLHRVVPGREFLEASCAEGSNLVCTPTAIVRTRLQKQLGGYRDELTHTGDMEMWMRFAAHADIGYLEADQAYYRLHSSNMSLLYFDEMNVGGYITSTGDLYQRKAAFDTVLREWGDRIPERGRLRTMATRSLAWAAFWGASHAFDRGNPVICSELLEFSRTAWPEIVSRSEWARFQWKQRVGSRVWRAIRPWARLLRAGRIRTVQVVA